MLEMTESVSVSLSQASLSKNIYWLILDVSLKRSGLLTDRMDRPTMKYGKGLRGLQPSETQLTRTRENHSEIQGKNGVYVEKSRLIFPRGTHNPAGVRS